MHNSNQHKFTSEDGAQKRPFTPEASRLAWGLARERRYTGAASLKRTVQTMLPEEFMPNNSVVQQAVENVVPTANVTNIATHPNYQHAEPEPKPVVAVTEESETQDNAVSRAREAVANAMAGENNVFSLFGEQGASDVKEAA